MTRLTRYLKPAPVKHLRIREDCQPFSVIRYLGYCGAGGGQSTEYTKEMDKVTCPTCQQMLEKVKKMK